MTDKEIGYDPDILMAACIQAAAVVLATKDIEVASDPVEIARLAAEIRDEALVQMKRVSYSAQILSRSHWHNSKPSYCCAGTLDFWSSPSSTARSLMMSR